MAFINTLFRRRGFFKKFSLRALFSPKRLRAAFEPDEWTVEGLYAVLDNTVIVCSLCLAFSVSLQSSISQDEAFPLTPRACAAVAV
jgi:hypothetical protein